MDIMWIEHLASWRTDVGFFTCEIWEASGAYHWAVYRNTGEYVHAGEGRTIEIAKRDALFAAGHR